MFYTCALNETVSAIVSTIYRSRRRLVRIAASTLRVYVCSLLELFDNCYQLTCARFLRLGEIRS